MRIEALLMNNKNYILFLLIICNLTVVGQRTETAINFYQRNNRLVLEVENDMLFQSDNYYTSGTAISYTNKRIKKTPTQLILSLINCKKDHTYTGFGVQQRIFTPYSIENPNSIENDRPYSAYILISNYSVLININNNLKISNEFGIGVMGKIAMGEEAQTIVHRIVGASAPLGWENQLGNAFLIDYQFRIEKTIFKNRFTNHFSPFAEARVGTLTDRIKIGFLTKWGNKDKYLKNSFNTCSNIYWVYLTQAPYFVTVLRIAFF